MITIIIFIMIKIITQAQKGHVFLQRGHKYDVG